MRVRYQALEIYAGYLRAVGYLVLVGAVALALWLGVTGYRSHDQTTGGIAFALAGAVLLVGLVHGLLAVAVGQLLCVFIDIEHNTRVAARSNWSAPDRAYAAD